MAGERLNDLQGKYGRNAQFAGRVDELIAGGMSKEDALIEISDRNQAHAMKLGADYDSSGNVTDKEWRQYQNGGVSGSNINTGTNNGNIGDGNVEDSFNDNSNNSGVIGDGIQDNTNNGIQDTTLDNGSAASVYGNAMGGNNTQEVSFDRNFTGGEVEIGGDNYGNVNSDFSVNFNYNDFMNQSGGSGYDEGKSMMNSYAGAWNTIQSNQNRANRDPNEFTKSYMTGMRMSGLI